MSRLIKFRCWDKELRKMFDVQSVDTVNEEVKYWAYEKRYSSQGYDMPTIPMQYTGLFDDNGKDIYEGDIVRIRDRAETKTSYVSVVEHTPRLGFCVKPHPAHEKMGIGTYRHLYDFCSYGISEETTCECEVIGNIYENPELLHPKETNGRNAG